MVDRFYGFRYELLGAGGSSDHAALALIQNEASSLGCFGWVQSVKGKNSIVGEARCSKAKGTIFMSWLEQTAASGKSNFLVRFFHILLKYFFCKFTFYY